MRPEMEISDWRIMFISDGTSDESHATCNKVLIGWRMRQTSVEQFQPVLARGSEVHKVGLVADVLKIILSPSLYPRPNHPSPKYYHANTAMSVFLTH